MTARQLRAAFNRGFCIGINRACPGHPTYNPRWFWIQPHETQSIGIITRKRGWGRDHRHHIWEAIGRHPEQWNVGREIDGKFVPNPPEESCT